MQRILCFISLLLVAAATVATATVSAAGPVPLIIDTDIANDYDDSWAITAALAQPSLFDVKLIITATKDTVKRAQCLATYLTKYNLQKKIAIGIGPSDSTYCGPLWESGWCTVNLTSFESAGGVVYRDGVAQVAKLIQQIPNVQFLSIAPMTNFGALLRRFPQVDISRVKQTAMFGSVHYCYNHVPVANGACQEYNVRDDPRAGHAWMAAPWESITTTPLDTCSSPLTVMGKTPASMKVWNNFKKLARSGGDHPWAHVLLDGFTHWCDAGWWRSECSKGFSDIMFDPTALWILMTGNTTLKFQELMLNVTENGSTPIVKKDGFKVNAALSWHGPGPLAFFEGITNAIGAVKV